MEHKLEIIESLHQQIAPNIIGNEFQKKVLTLQLFTNPAYERLHSLLVGNIGSGKSVLADFVVSISPNSIFCSKKTTPVGLAQSLARCNNGLIIIDELEKIKKETRDMLLEAMQFGRVTDVKYNTYVQLDAKTNVIAICNPMNFILQEGMSVMAQVPFQLALKSRFHLILPFYSVDPTYYPDIAEKFYDGTSESEKKQLLEYIMGVRMEIPFVDISKPMLRKVGSFIDLLKRNSKEKEMITPRLIEGALSMLKASARMNLRKQANENDYKYVYNILSEIYL